jgi:hypothetical protein
MARIELTDLMKESDEKLNKQASDEPVADIQAKLYGS